MERTKIILIGGGGHCKACIDVIEQTEQYDIIGVLDLAVFFGTEILGYKVIGNDNDIDKYNQLGYHFIITIGQIKSADLRKKIFAYLESIHAKIATIISPKAYVSKHARLGKGTIVMHGVTVNAAAVIGDNCILNTNCNVEHDVVIGNHNHISTHAVLNGESKLGNEVFVGSNVTLYNKVTIGDHVIIGGGSLVTRNILTKGTYIGYPIKKIR